MSLEPLRCSGNKGSCKLTSKPSLPIDRIIPASALGLRRHAFSTSEPDPLSYAPSPRMKRRGAISYEESDVTAQYIRYLGDALTKRKYFEQHPAILPELPAANTNLNLSVPKTSGRRGSLRQITASSSYKDTIKHTVIQSVNLEINRGIIKDNLDNAGNWNFDIFAFRRITEGRPLYHLGFHLLHKLELVEILNLDVLKVMKFLDSVEQAYHPENCYHNSTHAADVTQALYCLLSETKFFSKLTPMELLAALIAAMCHDLDHPGVNQAYLLNTSSHLAFIHGSRSLLEQHHCYEARAILKETGLLDHLHPDEKQEIMLLMDGMILATDVTQHGDFLNQFQEMLLSDNINLSNVADRHFMLTMAIKAADISNPSRNLELSKCWSEHIMEEFFRQGDSERKKNLPISAFCDRHTTIIPKSQSGFFGFVALPLFKAWCSFFDSPFSNHLCENIISNKGYWDQRYLEMQSNSEDSSSGSDDDDDDDNDHTDHQTETIPDSPDAQQPPTEGFAGLGLGLSLEMERGINTAETQDHQTTNEVKAIEQSDCSQATPHTHAPAIPQLPILVPGIEITPAPALTKAAGPE